jgi:uncharacterized protein YegL
MTDDTPQKLNVSRRKLLAGLGTIGLASAGAGLGTSAMFSDIESLRAALTAGRVDLFLDYRATYEPWLEPDEVEASYDDLFGPEMPGFALPIPNDDYTGDTMAYTIAQAPDLRLAADENDVDAGSVLSYADWGRVTKSAELESFLCSARDYTETSDIDGLDGALAALGEGYPEVRSDDDEAAERTLNPSGNRRGYINGDEGFMFDLIDVKPKDRGEVTMSLHLCGNDSYLSVVPRIEKNAENDLIEPEVTANDTDDDDLSVDPAVYAGELADLLHLKLWYDEDCDNRLDRTTDTASTEIDVALVIDESGSISNSELTQLRSAAKNVVDAIAASDLSAAVAFADSATLRQELTSDKNAVKGAIDSPRISGNTNTEDAIQTAQAELLSGTNQRASAEKVMVLLTDGQPTASDGPLNNIQDALVAADDAKGAGIEIFSVGIGLGSTGEAVLRAIAGETANSQTSYNSGTPDDEGNYFAAATFDDVDDAVADIVDIVVGGERIVFEGSLAAFGELVESLGGTLPLAGDTLEADCVLPEERECFEQGTYCYAFEWQLPCELADFEALKSCVVENADGSFGTMADELVQRGVFLTKDDIDVNVAQTDSLSFGFTFEAEQCRHAEMPAEDDQRQTTTQTAN